MRQKSVALPNPNISRPQNFFFSYHTHKIQIAQVSIDPQTLTKNASQVVYGRLRNSWSLPLVNVMRPSSAPTFKRLSGGDHDSIAVLWLSGKRAGLENVDTNSDHLCGGAPDIFELNVQVALCDQYRRGRPIWLRSTTAEQTERPERLLQIDARLANSGYFDANAGFCSQHGGISRSLGNCNLFFAGLPKSLGGSVQKPSEGRDGHRKQIGRDRERIEDEYPNPDHS